LLLQQKAGQQSHFPKKGMVDYSDLNITLQVLSTQHGHRNLLITAINKHGLCL